MYVACLKCEVTQQLRLSVGPYLVDKRPGKGPGSIDCRGRGRETAFFRTTVVYPSLMYLIIRLSNIILLKQYISHLGVDKITKLTNIKCSVRSSLLDFLFLRLNYS